MKVVTKCKICSTLCKWKQVKNC